MKINFLLLTILIVTVTSCSTSYKTGQTPDDVYYSPARLQTDDVKRERNDERDVYNNSSVYTTPEDRMIRRRHNRRYRRYDDRYGYDNPYGYNNTYGYPVYVDPKTGATQNPPQPRKTNLGAYKPNTTTGTDSSRTYDPKLGTQNTGTTTSPVRTFDKSNKTNGTGVGNAIRRILTNANSGSSDTYNSGNSNNSSSTRTFDRSSSNNNSNSNNFTNSNNSSSKTSSSNSSSAPVRTFKKDN